MLRVEHRELCVQGEELCAAHGCSGEVVQTSILKDPNPIQVNVSQISWSVRHLS